MSKWVIDIHGELEGDYNLIKKYEEQTIEAIPKDQYEARLKADMLAMLTEIQTEIEEYDVIGNHSTGSYDADLYNGAYSDGMARASSIIQQKIDKLRGEQA